MKRIHFQQRAILHGAAYCIAITALVILFLMAQRGFDWLPLRAAILAPAQSYTISGTVRNADLVPVQGALVSTGWGDPSIAFATTDSCRRFRL